MVKKYLPYIFVAVLAVILFHTCTREKPSAKEVIVEKVTVDTLHVYRIDTIVKYEPKYIAQRIVDTLYVTDTLYLPITQKHYNEPNVYDVWVSGYKARMDSIKTYNKVEYRNIEKEVVREITKNKYELYVSGSLNAVSEDFIPMVGVSLITPKKTQYKANVGLYKGDITYGMGVGFKLF